MTSSARNRAAFSDELHSAQGGLVVVAAPFGQPWQFDRFVRDVRERYRFQHLPDTIQPRGPLPRGSQLSIPLRDEFHSSEGSLIVIACLVRPLRQPD